MQQQTFNFLLTNFKIVLIKMMKRNFEQSKDDRSGKENPKKGRNESGNGEPIAQTNQSTDPEVELNEETEENMENELRREGTRKKKGRTSYVFQHFTTKIMDDQETEFAHCNYCPCKYKLSGKANGGTGNLNTHLRSKHQDKLPKAIEAEKQFEFTQERYRAALVKWVIISNQPFCECQAESFLEMIKTLNAEAKTISKETVKRDIMKKFAELVEEIKIKLSKSTAKFSFTLDAWTSKNCLPFMAIRAHWINSDWEYETVLLDFCYIQGKHDGLNFSKIFLDCLKRFDIPLSKVLGVTIDNVTSNDTFMSCLEAHGVKVGMHISSEENRVRCMPHILNLCVQDILSSLKIPLGCENDKYEHLDEEDNDDVDGDDDEGIIDEEEQESEEEEEELEKVLEENQFTVPKLRKLIKKVRKSTQRRQKLRKLCRLYKLDYLVPIVDVVTRWNSTYAMIERAEYLKAPLRALCSNEKALNIYHTTDTEWTDLKTLKQLLQKFDHSTKLMSMERHPTICSYLPTLNWLLESLETFIQDTTGTLSQAAKYGLDKLKKYESELQLNASKLPYVAVFLNPSLKISYFKEHGYSKPVIRNIQKSICGIFEKTYGSEPTNNKNDNSEESSDEFFEHMHKRAVNREPKEFQKYLNFPLSAPKVNVLEYWRSQKDEFPNLSNMARDHLAVQSGAVAVERDFSMGVDLVTPCRCSLKPQTIRACMCLKSWLKNLNCQSH